MALALAEKHALLEAQHRAAQSAAQIAIIACQIPHDSINAAILKSIVVWRETRKTKSEWNSERKRDVQICKSTSNQKSAESVQQDSLADYLEANGKAAYSVIDDATEPIPYLRFYNYTSFQQAIKSVNVHFPSFQKIKCLDFSGQLLGDVRLSEACSGLKRCPLVILNIGYNNITDKGMQILARCLRSLGCLQELILSGNLFSDAGVQAILENDCYSPTLRKIDLSCNNLGPKSAYFLGLMFSSDLRVCKLDSLFLGGKVGKRGWGNDFIRVLVEHLCRQGARPLRRLSIPSAALHGEGMSSLAALIASSTTLEVLNLTKNTLVDAESRNHLRHALRINSSLREFYYRQSGLSKAERDVLLFSWKSLFQVTWHEQVEIARCTAFELNKCAQLSYFIELEIFNNWQTGKPLPWAVIEATCPSKEEEAADTLNATLTDLCSSMGLTKALSATLANADSTAAFVKTLEVSAAELHEDVFSTAQLGLQSVSIAAAEDKRHRRKLIATQKKLILIGALEKFTGTKAGKKVKTTQGIGNSALSAVDKKATASKRKKKEKAGAIGINTLLMCIEDFHTACIEHGDAAEVYIGMLFFRKIEVEETKSRMWSSDIPVVSVGRSATKAAPPKRNIHAIPAFATLGIAASVIHYLYNFGPAEKERARKSQVAFERDQQKRMDADAKLAKKKLATRKGGPRFQIMRRDPTEARQVDEGARGMLLEDMGNDEKNMPLIWYSSNVLNDEDQGQGTSRDRETPAETDADADNEKNSDDDSGDDQSTREVTKFTVPKKDTQKKYGELVIEDLTDSNAAIKLIKQVLARGSRHTVARRMGMQVILREIKRDVSFPVWFEVENERSDITSRMPQLNTVRQNTALEARVTNRKILHHYERERALG